MVVNVMITDLGDFFVPGAHHAARVRQDIARSHHRQQAAADPSGCHENRLNIERGIE
jgi:hypothetical protein